MVEEEETINFSFGDNVPDDVITCQNCIRELFKQDCINLSVVVDKGKIRVTINN